MQQLRFITTPEGKSKHLNETRKKDILQQKDTQRLILIKNLNSVRKSIFQTINGFID